MKKLFFTVNFLFACSLLAAQNPSYNFLSFYLCDESVRQFLQSHEAFPPEGVRANHLHIDESNIDDWWNAAVNLHDNGYLYESLEIVLQMSESFYADEDLIDRIREIVDLIYNMISESIEAHHIIDWHVFNYDYMRELGIPDERRIAIISRLINYLRMRATNSLQNASMHSLEYLTHALSAARDHHLIDLQADILVDLALAPREAYGVGTLTPLESPYSNFEIQRISHLQEMLVLGERESNPRIQMRALILLAEFEENIQDAPKFLERAETLANQIGDNNSRAMIYYRRFELHLGDDLENLRRAAQSGSQSNSFSLISHAILTSTPPNPTQAVIFAAVSSWSLEYNGNIADAMRVWLTLNTSNRLWQLRRFRELRRLDRAMANRTAFRSKNENREQVQASSSQRKSKSTQAQQPSRQHDENTPPQPTLTINPERREENSPAPTRSFSPSRLPFSRRGSH